MGLDGKQYTFTLCGFALNLLEAGGLHLRPVAWPYELALSHGDSSAPWICVYTFIFAWSWGTGTIGIISRSRAWRKQRAGKHGFLQTFLGELLGEDEELCRSYTIYFFIFLSEQNRSRVSKPP